MECHIRISLRDEQFLSPASLVNSAALYSELPLTISSSSGDVLELTFTRFRNSHSHSLPSTFRPRDCHFEAVRDSMLNTLSACTSSTLSGIISTGSNYFILDTRNFTSFVLLPQAFDSCSLTTRLKREPVTKTNLLPHYYSDYNDGKWRYVELALIADYSVYAKYDKDESKVVERLQTIAHHVNALYYPLNIRVTLVWVEVWKDGDKFEVVTSGDRTLDLFLSYRKDLMKAHPNDNAHMITNIHFEQNVVGKAFKGTMCSYDYSGGVDVDHSTNAAIVAATVAHEMGHNFGMEHDVDYGTICNCPGNHCVMAPSTGVTPPSFWSDCSLRYIYNSFNRGVDLCLKNPPEKTVTSAKCGNGIVEYGEECDCGLEQCLHSCCDGKTCRLTEHAECAEGECCDILSCKPKPRATVCRASIGICDLPEYCNGDTPDCPADFFIQNGHLCPGRTNEFCYEGQCGSRSDQCQVIWGPTGREADRSCFQQNTNGIIQGNCGHDVHTGQYKRCLADDIMCGRLHCTTQAERPVFGDPTTVTSAYTYVRVGTETHQCHVIKSKYVDGKKGELDPGMVLDGSECGDEKICVDARCQDKKEVSKIVSKCNDQCHYRGVCNNVGNCHCENGFGGIACEIPGFGGSVNSNPSSTSRGITPSTLLLLLFAIVSVAVIIVCFFYWFKKKRSLPKEFWLYVRRTLKLYGVLVPVRKAPPPPRSGKHVRESLNAVWGDGGVTYSVKERSAPFVPPANPLRNVNDTGDHQPYGPAQLLTYVPPFTAQVASTKSPFSIRSGRPRVPPPTIPSRPRVSVVKELYRERGAEMGINGRTGFTSRDLPTSPPLDPTGMMKRDTVRPIQPPPPPPAEHLELLRNVEGNPNRQWKR